MIKKKNLEVKRLHRVVERALDESGTKVLIQCATTSRKILIVWACFPISKMGRLSPRSMILFGIQGLGKVFKE